MPRGRPKKQNTDDSTFNPEELVEAAEDISSSKRKTIQSSGFSLLDMGNDFVSQTKEALMSVKSKNKVSTMKSLNEIDKDKIPLSHFAWQVLFNSYGLTPGTVIEVLGPESCGKTTLMLYFIGQSILNNCPSLYINTEGKWLNNDRIKRSLHHDKAIANKIFNVLAIDEIFELKHCINTIEEWVLALRKNNARTVPHHIPLVIGIDTISKLMSPGEAAGIYAEGGYETDALRKKKKEVGESSNLEFSKLMHAWCRRLPYFLSRYNVLLLINSHQNQKINMSSFGGGSMIPADIAAEYNKTKIGGNALNQNALTQLILKSEGQEKKSSILVGKKIKARVIKNTGGAEQLTFNYVIRTHQLIDDEKSMQPSLDFDSYFPHLLDNMGVLPVTIAGSSVSCKDLGLVKVPMQEFSEEFHKDDSIMEYVGGKLGIDGYKKKTEFVLSEKPVIENPDTNFDVALNMLEGDDPIDEDDPNHFEDSN